MTTWNYRVIKTKDGMVGIGEVIYEGVEKIVGWIHPRDVSLSCEDYEWLKWDVEHMAQALNRPMLIETESEELVEHTYLGHTTMWYESLDGGEVGVYRYHEYWVGYAHKNTRRIHSIQLTRAEADKAALFLKEELTNEN